MERVLESLLKENEVIRKDDIFVAKEVAERTVWDKLAEENPYHAVISAVDEEAAALKSKDQIADIKRHVSAETVLLDVGAGYGRVAKYLLPQQSLAGYVALDSAYAMLSLFKRRHASEQEEQNTPVLYLNADIHTIPLKDHSVDMAIVCAVFLHNHKDVVRRSLAEIARVLKPGGELLVYSSFPNGSTLMGLQGHLYQFLLNLLGRPYKNGPVRYYSKREVVRLLGAFSEVDIYPTGFAVLPKSIIILPRFLDNLYRKGVALPVNRLLQKVLPTSIHHTFAMHFDVVAKK